MRFALTLVASLALVACGGSGSDSPSSGSGSLTKSNYVQVAEAVLATNAYLLDASSLFLGSDVRGAAGLELPASARLTKLMVAPTLPPFDGPSDVPEITEEACDDGGKIVIEYVDTNKNGHIDRGDVTYLKAYNCVYGDSVLNGQIKLTLDSQSGNPDTYPNAMSATAVYTNLSSTAGGVTTIGNGSMTYSQSEQSATSQDLSLFAASFSLTTITGTTTSSQTLKNYDVSLNARPRNGWQQSYISNINGTLTDSSLVSQSLTIKTTQPFVRLSDEAYADQGEVLVIDSSRAKVRAKVINATSVAIDLDEDGNGSYELGVNKLWKEIL